MDSPTRSLKRKTPENEQQQQPEEEPEEGKKHKTTHPAHNQPKSLVELDRAKAILSIKQKPIELCEVSNQIKKSWVLDLFKITKWRHKADWLSRSSDLVAVTEELESSRSLIHELSLTQNNLIACLVHES